MCRFVEDGRTIQVAAFLVSGFWFLVSGARSATERVPAESSTTSVTGGPLVRILGIETSCDETAAAVVDDGRLVRSNAVASQIPIHERFGGVVPEIASRQHVLAIDSVVELALAHACCDLSAINAVAVTYGPGLSGPLLVGTTFAKGLALGHGLPLLAVNHIEGHVLSVWLSTGADPAPVPELPMVALVASGGHTELVLVTAPGTYRILGQTVDDAAGEAFDKVGRLLGLPYPGGPSVEAVAATAGDRDGVPDMPRAWLHGTLNFSFSGLKTAMVRAVQAREHEDSGPLKSPVVARLASSFQESVADVLTRKLADAVAESGAASASIVGGVANNSFIRAMAARRLDVPLHVPAPGLSSDNAAMIAGAAFWNSKDAGLDLQVEPSLTL